MLGDVPPFSFWIGSVTLATGASKAGQGRARQGKAGHLT
jgi:hypothetical protein